MTEPELPRRAEVVVVGGGCMGASVAWHLARRDVGVALVERRHVGSGASGHSGAIVRRHYEARIGIRLARDSLAFFGRFTEETGSSCDFRRTGFLSGTRERDLAAFEALLALLKSERVKVERLTPSEAKGLEPQLDVSDYAAVIHDPDAGYADPIATADGFAKAAVSEDAVVLEGRRVTSVTTKTGRVTGVRVRGGTIESARVVLAAGNWTPELMRPLGVRLPVTYVRGEVAILRRPIGFGGPPRIHFDFYANTYSRSEGDKDTLVGYMNTDVRKTARGPDLADDSVPGATVRDLRTRLAKRFPIMDRAQPHGGWAGLYDVTPDSYPIVDQAGPEGLFVAVGFSGHGFKLCPEIGRLLAEHVATDKRPKGLEDLRASRFQEGQSVRPDAPFPSRRGPRLA